jgi:glutamyl-tRNA synthetase
VILRIEDLDATRSRPESIHAIFEDLRWLGIDWDEGPDVGGVSAPYLQSQRLARYRAALEILIDRELVYPCTCTRSEIERAASAPHAEDEPPPYPGTCAHRRAADVSALGDRSFAWRFRTTDQDIRWRDLVRGDCSVSAAAVGGDFIVARSGGVYAYQLAVVVDDDSMGVTEVVRGDDLVSSTPRQIMLDLALGIRVPQFGHLPLVVDANGRRLAKRDGSIQLGSLRDAGRDRDGLMAELARSLGIEGVKRGESPSDWVERFCWNRLPTEPFRWAGEDW